MLHYFCGFVCGSGPHSLGFCLYMPIKEVVLVNLSGGRVFIVLCVCVGFVGG